MTTRYVIETTAIPRRYLTPLLTRTGLHHYWGHDWSNACEFATSLEADQFAAQKQLYAGSYRIACFDNCKPSAEALADYEAAGRRGANGD